MWHIFLVGYFVFGAAGALLRRSLARDFGHHNRIINVTYFVFFLLPAGVFLAFLFPHDVHVGTTNLILLLGGSVIWPIYNVIGFRANKTVDAGIFTLVNSLSPLFTLAVAIPLLGEHVTPWQVLGVLILIVSGAIAMVPYIQVRNRNIMEGLSFCVLSAICLGVAVAYERFMLNRVDFGAYILFGWGAQIAWMVFLGRHEWRLFPELVRSVGTKTLTAYGLTNVLKSTCFILALLLSGSAFTMSGASDFMPLVIIIAAYFVLHEDEHLIQKFSALGFGIVGLLLLTLPL